MEASTTPEHPAAPLRPVLAVCGFSGSGKTTLLEAVIPVLAGRGLAVGIVKHDAHGFTIDRPGKDSDRLFRAGAGVCLRGPEEVAWRLHPGPGTGLERSVDRLLASCDLVLVEGHKDTPLPKVWLEGPRSGGPPAETVNVVATLPWGPGRPERLLGIVDDLLARAWSSRPVLGGLLVGGSSSRMGRPKQLLEHRGRSFAAIARAALQQLVDRTVVLGAGPLPDDAGGALRLPNPPGLAGPMAGLLAALRWAPGAVWVVAACDLPLVTPEAVAWLLSQRRPGVRAILPIGPGGRVEPLLAVYEPRAREAVEELAAGGALAPRHLRAIPGVHSPPVPAGLASAWRNVNTPADLAALPE